MIRIFIADDHPIVRQGLRELIARQRTVTEIAAELRVEEVVSDEKNEGQSLVVGAYQVSTKGYPVRAGDVETTTQGRSERRTFRANSDLSDRAELQQHFEGLMASPDSPVIANAAFFMRRAATST